MRQIAALEARKKQRGGAGVGVAVALGIGAVALIFAGRRPPGNGGGAAIPGGKINTITLSQGQVRRGRFRQDLIKQLDDNLHVETRLTFSTRDSSGNLITWPYRVRYFLVRSSDFSDILSETGFESGPAGFAPATVDSSTNFTLTRTKFVDGDRLKVVVIIEASLSKADGTPNFGTWATVASATSPNEVVIEVFF